MTTLKLYPLYHALCGEIAFYVKSKYLPSDIVNLDGTTPKKDEPIICGHCHNSTMDDYYYSPFLFKDDAASVEVTFDQVET